MRYAWTAHLQKHIAIQSAGGLSCRRLQLQTRPARLAGAHGLRYAQSWQRSPHGELRAGELKGAAVEGELKFP